MKISDKLIKEVASDNAVREERIIGAFDEVYYEDAYHFNNVDELKEIIITMFDKIIRENN